MPSRDDWHRWAGLWAQPSAHDEAALAAHLATVELRGDALDLYRVATGTLRPVEAQTLVPLVALRTGRSAILQAAALAGVEVAAEMQEPWAQAWIADCIRRDDWGAARLLCGYRSPHDSPAARQDAVMQARGTGAWEGLLLADVAIDRTPTPMTFPWSHKWRVAVRLAKTRHLGEATPAGFDERIDYTADGTRYISTHRHYVAGPVGPVSHSDTHRAYRADGTYLEWSDAGPRVYSPEESSRVGRRRRAALVDHLVGELAADVAAGGDLLTALHAPAVEQNGATGPSAMTRFLDIGDASSLVLLVQQHATTGVANRVAAALTSWL